eukprot:scaffold16880_cov126-Isochrysis_galbana.AAC.2
MMRGRPARWHGPCRARPRAAPGAASGVGSPRPSRARDGSPPSRPRCLCAVRAALRRSSTRFRSSKSQQHLSSGSGRRGSPGRAAPRRPGRSCALPPRPSSRAERPPRRQAPAHSARQTETQTTAAHGRSGCRSVWTPRSGSCPRGGATRWTHPAAAPPSAPAAPLCPRGRHTARAAPPGHSARLSAAHTASPRAGRPPQCRGPRCRRAGALGAASPRPRPSRSRAAWPPAPAGWPAASELPRTQPPPPPARGAGSAA